MAGSCRRSSAPARPVGLALGDTPSAGTRRTARFRTTTTTTRTRRGMTSVGGTSLQDALSRCWRRRTCWVAETLPEPRRFARRRMAETAPGAPAEWGSRDTWCRRRRILRRRRPRPGLARRGHRGADRSGRAGLAEKVPYAEALAELASAPALSVSRRCASRQCLGRSSCPAAGCWCRPFEVGTDSPGRACCDRRRPRYRPKPSSKRQQPERTVEELLAELDALTGLSGSSARCTGRSPYCGSRSSGSRQG